MKYGYARVSMVGQDLQVQLETLEREGCEKIYSEKFAGTKTNRPQFHALLSELQTADTIIVTKLDQLVLNIREGIDVVGGLFNKGIEFTY